MPLAPHRNLKSDFIAWALRVRPPEPVPVVLGRRRVYVLPTRAGLMYAMALFVMLIGAINYNLSLGYGLAFLLAALAIVSILHAYRNLVHLSLHTQAPAAVFAGETARFPLVLHNPDPRMRHDIRVSLPGQMAIAADVPAQDDVRVLLDLPAQGRGWLALPRITLDTVWPLGLVRAWGYAAPELRCLVYPAPAVAVPPAPTFDEHHEGQRAGDGGNEDFAGLRRHHPGDPPHHVAWKAAARMGPAAELQTKQFSGAAAAVLRLDWAMLPQGMNTETRLSVLTRWALDAAEDGLVWSLRLPGAELPPARGTAHLHACLEALALHED